MRIAPTVFCFLVANPFAWRADWGWGVPLIVFTVIIHVSCLGLIGEIAVHLADRFIERRQPTFAFVMVVGTTTLAATVLHAIEAGMWAFAYWFVGTQPAFSSAMLYSLNAITSYGHSGVVLEEHWRLMGAIESLNGWLLFGLTTAFLFAMIQKVWLLGNSEGRH